MTIRIMYAKGEIVKDTKGNVVTDPKTGNPVMKKRKGEVVSSKPYVEKEAEKLK